MLRLPPQFQREIEKPSFNRFALLEVQGPGVSDEVTTEAEWGANVGESNVDYDSTPAPPGAGDVVVSADPAAQTSGSDIFPTSTVLNDWGAGGADWHLVCDDNSDVDYAISIFDTPTDEVGWISGDFDSDTMLNEIDINQEIYQVKIVYRARYATTKMEDMIPKMKYKGVWYDGTNIGDDGTGAITTLFAEYSFVWLSPPDIGSGVWTKADLESIEEIGYFTHEGTALTEHTFHLSSLKLVVSVSDYYSSGYIETEYDLSGANTDNDIIVTVDQQIPSGAGLSHVLYKKITPIRPTDHHDAAGETVDEADAYNGNDTDGSTTTPTANQDPSLYLGRDAVNSDAWDAEPGSIVKAMFNCVVAKTAGAGGGDNGAVGIVESDDTVVNAFFGTGNEITKQTYRVDVTAYIGDLADLRIKVGYTYDSGGGVITIYDTWIDCYEEIGSVTDGSKAATGGATEFVVKSSFTSDGDSTAVLKRIEMEIPDRVYRFNDLGQYIFDSYPYIITAPARSIKLNLGTYFTDSSDISLTLIKDEVVLRMLREDGFSGLNADLYLGMYSEDMVEDDLVAIHRIIAKDFSISDEVVTVNFADATANLLESKVPIGSGVTKPVETYDGDHMVTVIEDLIDKAGVPDRYIDGGSFATLQDNVGDGTPVASKFLVVRTGDTALTESRPAKDLITELLELLGAFIIVQENGKMTAVEYDSSDAVVDSWTVDNFIEVPEWDAGLAETRDVCRVWYDWDGSGESEEDFVSIKVDEVDADSRLIKDIKSKWIAGDSTDGHYGEEIADHVAAREVARLGSGQGGLTCKTHFDRFAVQVADMVDVTHQDIVSYDVGVGDTRKFLVVQKDPYSGPGISWLLVEAR